MFGRRHGGRGRATPLFRYKIITGERLNICSCLMIPFESNRQWSKIIFKFFPNQFAEGKMISWELAIKKFEMEDGEIICGAQNVCLSVATQFLW